MISSPRIVWDERCKENYVSCFNITVKLKIPWFIPLHLLMLITIRSIIVMKIYWFLKFNKNSIWRLCWLWLEGGERSGVVGKLEGGFLYLSVSMQQSLWTFIEISSVLQITRKCLQSAKTNMWHFSELFRRHLSQATFRDLFFVDFITINLRMKPKATTFCFH